MEEMIDLILNLDENIVELITTYGSLIYLILLSIIFIETGLERERILVQNSGISISH